MDRGAEMIAREVRNFNDINTTVPRITRHMRLPVFRYAALDPYILAAGPKIAPLVRLSRMA
jgi:hypothetical protein